MVEKEKKDPKKKKSNFWLWAFGIPLAIVLSLLYLPHFWIYVFLIVDHTTPWVLFDSPLFMKYHEYLISKLPEREELAIPELDGNNFTTADVLRLSKHYTFPIIIRGLVKNSTGIGKWQDKEWWIENYGEEEILCGTLNSVRPSCTIKDFFDEVDAGNPFYVSGASKIFSRNPALAAMVDVPQIKDFEPGPRISTQVFMGLKDMGSDIHAAIGVNIFRQMAGTKKWWFIPPSQTPYLIPSVNVNGFSAHTHTLVGKNGEKMSPWMNKLERYTATLHAGDVLINPPWFWHGILNEGAKDELVIGVPTRYAGTEGVRAAMKSNLVLSLIAVATILKQYGSVDKFMNQDDVLEDRIQANRLARMKDPVGEAIKALGDA